MKKLFTYFQESNRELGHVKWPTKKQLMELTGIVLGITFAAAFFTGVLDFIFQEGFTLLLKVVGK